MVGWWYALSIALVVVGLALLVGLAVDWWARRDPRYRARHARR